VKIAVCLPSFNEADNIQNITKVIDQGLSLFSATHPDMYAEIINVDSNSSDGTANLFLETKTKYPKRSIVINKAAGKGKNIFEFCSYAVSHNIDFCLTIDSDITSIAPEWVTILLTPLVEKGATYVTPIYERSRFESSSTNHFAFPLIYALYGKIIRQPIAGDFSFTRQVAQAFASSDLRTNESIQRYGIDVFMTITAIGTRGTIAQVDLQKKIHAPSFNKLEYMFPQIAASLLLTASSVLFSKNIVKKKKTKANILPSLNFAHKESAKAMRENALTILKSSRTNDWANTRLASKFLTIAEREIATNGSSLLIPWTDLLSCWIEYFLKPSLTTKEAERAGNELLPFFVLRATNFWFWAETVDVESVELAITKQAKILREKLSKVRSNARYK